MLHGPKLYQTSVLLRQRIGKQVTLPEQHFYHLLKLRLPPVVFQQDKAGCDSLIIGWLLLSPPSGLNVG